MGDFFSLCGHQLYNQLFSESPHQPVTRPAITVPGGSPFGSDRFAFWYLNGLPSIDGYYVQAQLLGQDNWTPGPGESVGSRTWQVIDQPSKISLSTTSGGSTVATSQQASSGMTYDVSVVYKIDGFSSPKFWLNLNTLTSLTVPSPYTVANSTCPPGYRTILEYSARDLWNYPALEIATNETHTNVQQPNGSNWGTPASDKWRAGNRDEWIDSTTFADSIYAGNCAGTLNPAPVGPGENGYSEAAAFLNLRTTQKLFMGSLTNGQGKLMKTGTMQWFKDHGKIQ